MIFKKLRNWFSGEAPQIVEPLSPQLDAFLVSQMIAGAIQAKKPFLVSRLGFTEARCLSQPESETRPTEFVRDLIWRYSGVFPNTVEQFLDFREKYLSALQKVDLLGLIRNPAERKLVELYAGNVVTCDLGALEPYLHPFPWSKYLAGKSVLVVHPYVDSINAQFNFRERLFLNPEVLPSFEL
jgi:hypothetical protein